MKNKIRLKGQLKAYIQWPLILTGLLLVMNVLMYTVSLKAGGLMSIFLLVYMAVAFGLYAYNRPALYQSLIQFATEYGSIQERLLKDLALPYALLDDTGKVVWCNDAFIHSTGKSIKSQRMIGSIFPEITKEILAELEEKQEYTVSLTYKERDYRVDMCLLSKEDSSKGNTLVDSAEYENNLIALYLFDETEMNRYIRENKEQRLVAGLIYLDNYDEALESVEEVRRSLLIALIDRKINKYITSYGGIVKKLEKDKYFVALQEKTLPLLRENKFDLLQDVKTVNIGNEMAVTLSIGLGFNGTSYGANYEYARIAIELALARGGDQIVIKDNENISYFGGKTQQVDKSTRVKARVKAHALREFIAGKDRVIVMGHRMTDVDSFGAAIGIFRAAEFLGKRGYIVINDVSTSVRPMMEGFLDNPIYKPDMFLNSTQAMELVDANTVVVVVDTNRPSYTECPELLKMSPTVVVFDHHRQGSESITGAVLSYIEPYASSACEMVAEILQYFDEGIKIKPLEADCLYAGIIIDTDNFMSKTGVRTFEAAAFLRRCGADVTRVRKMFRNDMGAYKAKAEVVRHAEVYREVAISVCPSSGLESPTIIGAQAANELLNITGVKASIVLTEYQDKVYISARSIDEINVQLIMERLGGGGHMNIAGAQLACGLEEAIEIVKHTLDKMMDEGEV